jgi:hypothetical protein
MSISATLDPFQSIAASATVCLQRCGDSEVDVDAEVLRHLLLALSRTS